MPESCLRALQACIVAGGAMAIFEVCRMAFRHDLQLWISGTVSILFTALVAGVASFWTILKGKGALETIAATEERYRLLFEGSMAAAYRTSLDGRILDCNLSFCQMFGFASREEAIGRSVNPGFVDREDRASLLAQLRAENQVTHFEQQLRRADGKLISVLNSAALVEDDATSETFIRGTLTEVTELRDAEQEQRRLAEIVRKSEAKYRLLFEQNPVPMWVFDRSTLRFLAMNQAAIQKYGYSEPEFLNMTTSEIQSGKAIPQLLKNMTADESGLQAPESRQHRLKDGSVIDVEIVCHDLDFNGIDAILAAAYDVTDRERAKRMLEESESRYRVLFEDSPDAYWLIEQGRFADCNTAALELFGFTSKSDFTDPASISPSLQPDGTPSLVAAESRIAAALQNGTERYEWVYRRRNGEAFFADVSLAPLRLNGRTMLLASARDIGDRKAAEARAQYFAYYDALTDLPNRTLLKDRMEVGLAGARRRGEEVALLFLDVDRFTVINDTLGRSFGDRILREVAQKLKRSVREQDTVARVESDGFVILLNSVQGPGEAGATARRLMELLAQPFDVEDRTVSMSCSIGVSMFPRHGADGETLLKNAEAAMHSAKDDGRNTFRFFSEEINGKAAQELALENALRTALARNEFYLVYQPQLDLRNEKIIGMEALLRWRHPEFGLVPTDRFIRIAEKSGMILSIGEWVLRTACAQLHQWQAQGLACVPVAVNVSPVQFRSESFCALVKEVLRETGVPTELLELELTESLLLANPERANSMLREFTGMGVMLAIDDFGTGYSSLSYLKQFRVNKLKIDRSFIHDLPADPDDVAITTAIISMAKSLDLRVIAEGVETREQMLFLRDRHCDEIQGYYFSKPVMPAEMAAKLDLLPAEAPLSSPPQRLYV